MNKDRLAFIEQELKDKGRIQTTQIADTFGITKPTARKYLDAVVKSDLRFSRVHGGAVLLRETYDSGSTQEYSYQEYSYRTTSRKEQKRLIAEKAAGLVNDRDTLFIDSGTTCFEFASSLLKSDKQLTVVTNGLRTGTMLSQNPNIAVALISGFIRWNSNTIIDEYDAESWRAFNIDTYYFSASAVSIENGFSEYSMNEIRTKRQLIKHASHSVALVDSSKLDRNSTGSFAALDSVSCLITDNDIDDSVLARYAGIIKTL